MHCIICGAEMAYFFSKTFGMKNLPAAAYHRCGRCGFCASKTHFEMSDAQWSELNHDFHAETHYTEGNPYNRNQRYFHQAEMLNLARRFDMVRGERWLDWGCGVGAVSKLLDTVHGIHLGTYDRYFTPEHNAIDAASLVPRSFDLVLNTAVIEHVRDRQTLDEIEAYVADGGSFAIHTLVPESVPQDPNWMYLLPVHTAFHTNRSMQILMDQWGYACSVYNEHAKLWVLFREPAEAIAPRVDEANRALGWDYFKFKAGFMDYWK